MKIEEARKKIDLIDYQIVGLLVRRLSLVRVVGVIKKQKKLPVYQKQREIIIFNLIRSRAKKKNVSPKRIIKIFEAIIKESKIIQKK